MAAFYVRMIRSRPVHTYDKRLKINAFFRLILEKSIAEEIVQLVCVHIWVSVFYVMANQ